MAMTGAVDSDLIPSRVIQLSCLALSSNGTLVQCGEQAGKFTCDVWKGTYRDFPPFRLVDEWWELPSEQVIDR